MMRKFRFLFLVLLICWMGMIFLFSARTADESTKDSYGVAMMIGRILHPDFDRWSEDEQSDFVEEVHYLVRKTAHAMEYAVLGILCVLTLLSWFGGQNRYFLFAVLISVFYAATDEFHQLFVPGRAGQLTDVLIDSAGVLVGVLAVWLIRMIRSKRRSASL